MSILKDDAEKGRKLGSVDDVYDKRSHGRGGNMKLLYGFLPTLPGKSETFTVAEQALSYQYLSRFQGCPRQSSPLVRFSNLPDSSRLR